jgi:hypothetical protein
LHPQTASCFTPEAELTFELEPVRAQSDAAEGAALTFDLIITNRGSAPARDVLIEAQLINANPQVDAASAASSASLPERAIACR